MTVYIEIHALQNVPPSNINRDESGTPKSAVYGGTVRSRVSSQSWKRAIREDFNRVLDPKLVGTRSRQLVADIAAAITVQRADLSDRAENLAVAALEAAGIKRPEPRKTKKQDQGIPETGYLLFLSRAQIEALARAAVKASEADNPLNAMKAAKVKQLIDADHSIDIALFGRMVADAADLNVDAACQVAHALSVHTVETEYDFYTAVDDSKSRSEDELDAGAGMMGNIGFVSATLYRYAAINIAQLKENLGNEEAQQLAIASFLRSFINAIPSGKQTSFAHNTRPAAVLVTVATGQPTSLVGAFEKPVLPDEGYLKPAVKELAKHADEVFTQWRKPSKVYVYGLTSNIGDLKSLGEVLTLDELIEATTTSALELQ